MVIARTNPPNPSQTTISLTPEQYREIEETSAERHEYRNGETIAISGGSATHSAIASNLLIYLGFLLRDTDFRLYNSDLRIWIPDYNHGTYADMIAIDRRGEKFRK
jgi:Uma2 family endonuclease